MDLQKVPIEAVNTEAPFILRRYDKHHAVQWHFAAYDEPICYSVTTEFNGILAPTIYPQKESTVRAAIMRGWTDETDLIKSKMKKRRGRPKKKV